MRIAAKRLRYILEVTGPCFGPYAKNATKMVKDLQDLLGEIHDCDVQIPDTAAFAERLRRRTPPRCISRPARRRISIPRCSSRRRTRASTPGSPRCSAPARAPAAAVRPLPGALGRLERKGFRARLEYAVGERAGYGALASGAP